MNTSLIQNNILYYRQFNYIVNKLYAATSEGTWKNFSATFTHKKEKLIIYYVYFSFLIGISILKRLNIIKEPNQFKNTKVILLLTNSY